MSKININLAKAGVYYLIDKDKDSFIDKISLYLSHNGEVMDFLFNDMIPINEEIESKIAKKIQGSLPSPEYFKGIVNIELGFSYSNEQVYIVTYKADRFYSVDRRPYNGNEVPDAEHPIVTITELSTTINPKNENF